METIVVASPLRFGCCSKPYAFSAGVAIREIQPILWGSSAKKSFSDEDQEYLGPPRFWISTATDVEDWPLHQLHDSLYEKAHRAMYALQIICPSGGRNVYLKLRETEGGLDYIGSSHPAKMHSTLIGRRAILEQQGLRDDFDKIFHGVNRAFDEKIVRLENPILLLEHGLQTGHVYLSTLMWVMGLDMLFMAGGEKARFAERIKGFLGAATPVFPSVSYPESQPALTVGEIVEDTYDLRSLIAHGLEIPERPFRERRDIIDTNGLAINTNRLRYAELIMEASIFLLAKSLRKIMVEGLIDLVKDSQNWKYKLQISERLGHWPGA